MKCLLATFLVVFAQFLIPQRVNSLQKWFTKRNWHRIVGGKHVFIEAYPYTASLRENGFHFCGGSIISKNTVLTAAHCFSFLTKGATYTVVGGETNSNGRRNEKGVNHLWGHAGFKKRTGANDIGVVKIKGEFEFNERIQPIPLNRDEIPCGEIAVLSGWGSREQIIHNQRAPLVRQLSAAETPVVCFSNCYNAYHNTTYVIDNTIICNGLEFGGVDSCQGDSGGPLAYNGKLIGVISSALGCADANYPGVNTKVAAYLDWIEQFLKD